MSKALDDCESLDALQERAKAKISEQSRVISGLRSDDPKRLVEERVLSQMRCNEAAVELNRSLNDCTEVLGDCDVSR